MSLLLILMASLLGSPHCAAMCGGFVAACSQQPAPGLSQAAYHGGRLMTYLFLGFISGLIGANVNQIGQHFGVAQIATVITASLLILVGVSGLFDLRAGRINIALFRFFRSIQTRLLPARSRTMLYPFCIGLFSTFLPCGWLYTYVAVAASRASISSSMLVMLVFWCGTLPLLATIGGLSNIIVSPLAKFVPRLASLLMITAGTISLLSHISAHPKHSSDHTAQSATHSFFCVDSIQPEQSN